MLDWDDKRGKGHLHDLFVAISTKTKYETQANKIMVCMIPKAIKLSWVL